MNSDANTPTGQRDDPVARRRALESRNNPNLSLDYVVLIDSGVSALDCLLRLRYVPDKLILEPQSFDHYLLALRDYGLTQPEEIALTILEDINNQVVPRWVQITLRHGIEAQSGADPGGHCIVAEDRQPNWNNSQLLSRLPPHA
jgi:7-cyano-7-deazaguanine reductase